MKWENVDIKIDFQRAMIRWPKIDESFDIRQILTKFETW